MRRCLFLIKWLDSAPLQYVRHQAQRIREVEGPATGKPLSLIRSTLIANLKTRPPRET